MTTMAQEFSPSCVVSYRTNQVAATELCRQPVDMSNVAGLRRRMKAEAVAIGVYGLYWHGRHVPNGIGVIPGIDYRTDLFDDAVIRDQTNTQTAIEILREDLTDRYIGRDVPVDPERINRLVGESCDGPYLIKVHAPLFMADHVAELLGGLEVDPVLSDSTYHKLLAGAVTEALDEWFIDEVASEVRQVDSLPDASRPAAWASSPDDGEITRWIIERAQRVSSYDDLRPDVMAAELLTRFSPATVVVTELRRLAATGPEPPNQLMLDAAADLISNLVNLDAVSSFSHHTDTSALWDAWHRFNQTITVPDDSEEVSGHGC